MTTRRSFMQSLTGLLGLAAVARNDKPTPAPKPTTKNLGNGWVRVHSTATTSGADVPFTIRYYASGDDGKMYEVTPFVPGGVNT